MYRVHYLQKLAQESNIGSLELKTSFFMKNKYCRYIIDLVGNQPVYIVHFFEILTTWGLYMYVGYLATGAHFIRLILHSFTVQY